MKRILLLLALSQAVFAQDPEWQAKQRPDNHELPSKPKFSIDGKVNGLSDDAFRALELLNRSERPFSDSDAHSLKAAILKDGTIDDGEWKLLEEMTQTAFKTIQVTSASDSSKQLKTYPRGGTPREILLRTIYPKLDFAAALETGKEGFLKIAVVVAQSPSREAEAVHVLEQKLLKPWQQSNSKDAYKPLRDEISRYFVWCSSAPPEVKPHAKSLLYLSLKQLDKDDSDRVPDFLYSWLLSSK
jgi:hypothetical protein